MNLVKLVEAVQKFVRRVDEGEVRSFTSYNEFKQALDAPDVPIDMVLFCPACGTQHIDAPDMEPCIAGCMMAKDYGFAAMEGHHCSSGCMYMQEGSPRWTNPPHMTHECQNKECGHKWRPASVHTNGVEDIPLGTSDTRPPLRQKTIKEILAKIKLNSEFPKLTARDIEHYRAIADEPAHRRQEIFEQKLPSCPHPFTRTPDQRYPLRYGSAQVLECVSCGWFKLNRGAKDPWEPGPYEQKRQEAEKRRDEEC